MHGMGLSPGVGTWETHKWRSEWWAYSQCPSAERAPTHPRHGLPVFTPFWPGGISPQIPPLGKHYSQRWAQEDLLEEQKDGARAAAVADKKKGLMGPLTELDTKGKVGPVSLPTTGQDLSSQLSAHLSTISLPTLDVDALLKKSEAQHEQPEDGCPFGALTQRLLQALVEVSTLTQQEIRLLSVLMFYFVLRYVIHLESYTDLGCIDW